MTKRPETLINGGDIDLNPHNAHTPVHCASPGNLSEPTRPTFNILFCL